MNTQLENVFLIYEDDWYGGIIDNSHWEEECTYKDLDTHRYQCTQFGRKI